MTRIKLFKRGLYFFIKTVVRPWFLFFYPVKITNPEILKTMKAPYLLLPNHIMKWDAVILSLIFPLPLNSMASESHFRNPVIGFFFSLIGVFPKAKAKSDLGAIRHMMDLKGKGRVICVFPEGQLSWDGGGMPLFYSTAKLIKLLKIPVYVPLFSGGSGVFPRWGKSRRKGPMELTIHPLFADGRDVKKLDSDEIFEKLTSIISYKDMDLTIPGRNWRYKSTSRAEYLEALLFICPSCRSIASLHSQGNQFYCRSCSFETTLDDQYRFHYKTQGQSFQTVLQWNQWQEQVLPELLRDYRNEKTSRPFIIDHDILIKTGFRMDPLRPWTRKGKLALFSDHILVRPEKGDIRRIPLTEMNGVHVMTRQKLEFYHDKTLYVFFFSNPRTSGYKWLCTLRKLAVPSSYAWHGEEVEKI
ncbi:lysophospholipid acyltransferase family protein [Oceanispirochaeta sp.]|uniref:lysophospholipid acyltransferase family protein n=1 Tax=Oceanispirochaeta sp. TaxID=2035350 RepID=UPI00262101DF|nr:lysophospholipid acyltransferase family protein [Oceanispirochaeta sp.]MDA3958343.1 lysophospholipid acyltransferase family protein [Oceanispirochaeta sp.]